MTVDDDLRKRLTEAMAAHTIECTGLGEVTCRCRQPAGWMSWYEHRRHVTDALVPVIREALAEAKHDELHAYADALAANTSPDDTCWRKSDYVSDVREWADTNPWES